MLLKIVVPLSLVLLCSCARMTAAECSYSSDSRTLTVSLKGKLSFKYVFNRGGAVNGIFDLLRAPGTNLIGKPYKGETTDRVIQWTYWNSMYKAPVNQIGSKDCRANVTMEGSYGDKALCEIISTPKSGNGRTLVFKSRIRSWFYSHLDKHGKPDFTTESSYEVLEDGSLKLTRKVTRGAWVLKDVLVKEKGKFVPAKHAVMQCLKMDRHSTNSYFEGWSTFNRLPLPKQIHGKGEFEKDGYKFWKPKDLGGWAMAYGKNQAVALVFGSRPSSDPDVRPVFNKLDLPSHELNILLPAIELNWPEKKTLTQVLVIIPGSKSDVMKRAVEIEKTIPAPILD